MTKTPGKKLQMSIFNGVVMEGNNEKHVALIAKVGGSKTKIYVPASSLLSPKECAQKLVAAGLEIYDLKALISLINDATANVRPKTVRVVVSSGWHGTKYHFHGKLIGPDDATQWVLQSPRVPVAVPAPLNDDLWSLLTEESNHCDFLMMAILLVFVCPLLDQDAERPMIHLWGPSRTGKTTFLRILAALSRPKGTRDLHPFNFTERAMEEILSSRNGELACFDEVGTISESKLDEILASLLYLAGNGRGRLRSQSGAADRRYPNMIWSTMPVITGEKDLSTFRSRMPGTGQDARLLVFAVPPGEKGGILNRASNSPEDQRRDLLKQIECSVATYTGSHYESWIELIAASPDRMKGRFDNYLLKAVNKLDSGSLTDLERNIATKFGWFAACGRILIKEKIVNWDKSRLDVVIKRFFLEDKLSKQVKSRQSSKTQTIARAVLALAGLEYFKKNLPSTPGMTRLVAESRINQGWINIKKGSAINLVGFSDIEVIEDFQLVPGLLHSRVNSHYYQSRISRVSCSALRINIEKLVHIAYADFQDRTDY